ncbi:MAG: DUF4091 domain-containing protein, partial [Propionibacteriales bacterium]|nr:DUF4091 domain-containing protein [Propionibacteriales bacterium]
LELSGVRNAPVSAQLAVAATSDLEDLTVDVLPGHPPNGTRPLPRDAVTLRYPAYIPVEGTNGVTADPLESGPVDVEAGNSQPIWLTIDVPRSLSAGSYGVELRIAATGTPAVVHELVVDVADVTVSDPEAYDLYLNLWFQPDAVAYAHDVPLYSEEHWDLLDTYLEDMASRGQKVANAAIIEDPWEIGWPDGTWRAQTYHPFHTLVDWEYDGSSWDFDYGKFDRYIEASRRAGIGPDIRVYALLMFGGRERLYYTDARSGETVREVVQLGDTRWREAWSAFLSDFGQHLKQRGWFDDTMLAFDERPASTMAVVQDFLAESAPEFAEKVHIAVHTMDVDTTIPDISFAHGLLPQLTDDLLAARREAGHVTTFYTTGGPLTPNTITASPPIGARLLSWIPVQYGLDGYLRWSYNSWPADPFTDPAYRYAQGDEYIVYPGEDGPMSSIRWETFRDGVVDHELLRQLARRAGESNPVYQDALAMVDANASPSAQLYGDVLAARQLVVEELERYRDLEVDVAATPTTAVAGDRVEVDVTIRNTGRQPVIDVNVALAEKEGWVIETVDGGRGHVIQPGDELSTRFAVTVPDSVVSGSDPMTAELSLRREGRPVALEAVVPLDVQSAVGITDVSADPAELAAGQPTTLTVGLVNRRSERISAEVRVDAPDGWQVDPGVHDVELAAGAEPTVTFRASPGASAASGRHQFVAEAVVDGVTVEHADARVTYNEAAVEGVTIHSVSSEELVGEDGAADNLVDGDPVTLWHSKWFDGVAQPPHEVVLDLGAERPVHALTYLPRQTGGLNGGVKDYEVYVGNDPDSWGEPVATGVFAGGRAEQRADFPAVSGRYLRFVILSEQSGQPFASGAELTPLGAP